MGSPDVVCLMFHEAAAGRGSELTKQGSEWVKGGRESNSICSDEGAESGAPDDVYFTGRTTALPGERLGQGSETDLPGTLLCVTERAWSHVLSTRMHA